MAENLGVIVVEEDGKATVNGNPIDRREITYFADKIFEARVLWGGKERAMRKALRIASSNAEKRGFPPYYVEMKILDHHELPFITAYGGLIYPIKAVYYVRK